MVRLRLERLVARRVAALRYERRVRVGRLWRIRVRRRVRRRVGARRERLRPGIRRRRVHLRRGIGVDRRRRIGVGRRRCRVGVRRRRLVGRRRARGRRARVRVFVLGRGEWVDPRYAADGAGRVLRQPRRDAGRVRHVEARADGHVLLVEGAQAYGAGVVCARVRRGEGDEGARVDARAEGGRRRRRDERVGDADDDTGGGRRRREDAPWRRRWVDVFEAARVVAAQ